MISSSKAFPASVSCTTDRIEYGADVYPADTIEDIKHYFSDYEYYEEGQSFMRVIELNAIPLSSGTFLRAKISPCIFGYTANKSEPYYEVDDTYLDISLWANSISDLEAMLKDHIAMLWEQYARYDGQMTEDAKRLKRTMLEIFEQAP